MTSVQLVLLSLLLFCCIETLSYESALAAETTPKQEEVYRELGYVTLLDGVRLAYITYRPTKSGRYPTVLRYDAYESSGESVDDEYPKLFLQNGYAYVGVNVRGSGCSGGQFSILDPQEGKDGAEVIEWIARQKWSDGKVGMIGDSYPGHTQIMTAYYQPRHLKAIAPGGLTSDLYKDTCYPGGIPNAYCANWGFFSQPASAARGIQSRLAMGDTECKVTDPTRPARGTYRDILRHPLHDDWWEARALESYIHRVSVPALIIQGWQDNETGMPGPVRLFRQLNAKNKQLLMMNGSHYVYFYVLPEVVRWMDHWLKRVPNGVDKDAPVTVWFETILSVGQGKSLVEVTAHPSWKATFSQWPPRETQWLDFYLADKQLSSVPPKGAQDDSRQYIFPSGTEVINGTTLTAPVRWGTLAYRTVPVEEDVTIVGAPQLTLFLSSDQRDTDLMVALHDIAPDGNTLFLQRDYLRASMRHVDQGRSFPDDLFFTFDHPEPLTPGQVYRLDLSIMAFAHVLRKGHSLELMIMSPPSQATPNWGLVPLGIFGVNTVYQSAQFPSKLKLPVIPGLTAQAKEPECGSLELQPCRRGAR
jgi:putative CocE/NonD family hydrolase